MRNITRSIYVSAALFLLSITVAGVWETPSAYANDITVTSIDDVLADDGLCTLREAMNAANLDTASGASVGECPAGSGADTINLTANAIYTLSLGGPTTFSEFTIEGNGATIERSSAESTPQFSIFFVNASGNLTLNNLTLTNGDSVDVGGGIYNSGGTVIVNESVLTGNNAIRGGGIWQTSGDMTLDHTMITGNTARDGGGIIASGGNMTISNSAIQGNNVTTSGAGIKTGSDSSVAITDSVISGNNALFSGGGISNSTNATLLISNSSVTGNTGIKGGGGIANSGNLTVLNTTVSGNSSLGTGSREGGAGIWNNGIGETNLISSTIVDNKTSNAGIFVLDGEITLTNSIIGHHGSKSDCEVSGDFEGTLASDGYNIDTDYTCNLTEDGDMPAVTPFIGPLQDNGGPTQTHALISGSPAIDAIPPGNCVDADGNQLTTDQRGVARPQSKNCDIGAVEAAPILVGDFNCDGVIDIKDAILMTRLIVNLPALLSTCGGL